MSEGAPEGGGEGQEGQQGGGSTYTPPATQAELDRIIAERVNRTKSQFKDYNDLRTKAAEFDRMTEAQKSESQKAHERAEKAEQAVAAATQRAVRAEVRAIASGEFADPTDVYLFLGDLGRFIDKSGEIDSGAIESALKDLEKAKPHLVARPRTDVGIGARGGTAAATPSQFMNDLLRRR